MLRFSLITALCFWISLASLQGAPEGSSATLRKELNRDSLWSVWNDKTQTDTNRLKAIHKIAWDGYLFSQPDSAFYFAGILHDFAESVNNQKWKAAALNIQGVSITIKGDYKEALSYYNESLKIFEEIEDKNGIAASFNYMGALYDEQGNYEEALNYYKKSLTVKEEIGDKSGIATSLGNIGKIYHYYNNYEEALIYYKKSLKIAEEIGDKSGVASYLCNTGIIYKNQGNNEEALNYYKKSLAIFEEIGEKYGIANALNNIGVIYRDQGNYEEALSYYKKSLTIKEEIGNKRGIASSYTNIGIVYKNQGNYDEALNYYKKSLTIKEEIGDKHGIAGCLANLGNVYNTQGNYEEALSYHKNSLKIKKEIGDNLGISYSLGSIGLIYKNQGNFSQAQTYLLEALKTSKEINALVLVAEQCKALYRLYKQTGKYKRALNMHELYLVAKDTLVKQDAKEAATELKYQHRYETKAKVDSVDNLRIQQVKDKEIFRQQAELNVKKNQQLMLFGVLGLAILFSLFMINRFRVTNRQKKVIEEQKQKVEEQKKDITDSIQYAENIQRALLPTINNLKDALPDGFVLFQPKDIVSGDFYWLQHHKSKVYFAACDCMGHGVPGAFMSMIGSSLLDEAVVEKGLTKPNDIFFEVRKGFINALKQTEETGTQNDGMDAVLCSWDKNGTLEYSLAYNPLLLIRGGEILETKADKQPVGFHTGSQKPFTHHKLKLEKGDTIYLFSDGYSDQFGGPKDKKFMMKNFRKLLLSIQDKTMNEQKAVLETTMTEWKGDTEQVDDILVMGVRF